MLTGAELDRYREERRRRLERENELLAAERRRLEGLLADALVVATAGTGVTPTALLEVLAAARGTNPSRPAYVEHREQEAARAQAARAVAVLRETAA